MIHTQTHIHIHTHTIRINKRKKNKFHAILVSSLPVPFNGIDEREREKPNLMIIYQFFNKKNNMMSFFQGSSKHFITHSAITCSVQTEDIVACVLLLYNPITKCPLHIHAYRCDSESTAQALNQQLQVLINRPENQKRFAELEARFVITHLYPN